VSERALWLSAAALLLLLAVSALGVAVTFLDPNDYKPQIVAAVQQTTGRTLSLGGPLRISRSLWPTIEVTDVTLANLPGGTRPDLARVERIEAQLSLPALLRRRIEVSKLALEGPNILFEFVGDKPNCPARWARGAIRYGDGWIPGGDIREVLPKFREMAREAGRDPAGIEITSFALGEDLDRVKRLNEIGVARVVPMFPPEKADKVLPIVDRWTKIMQQVNG